MLHVSLHGAQFHSQKARLVTETVPAVTSRPAFLACVIFDRTSLAYISPGLTVSSLNFPRYVWGVGAWKTTTFFLQGQVHLTFTRSKGWSKHTVNICEYTHNCKIKTSKQASSNKKPKRNGKKKDWCLRLTPIWHGTPWGLLAQVWRKETIWNGKRGQSSGAVWKVEVAVLGSHP